MSNLVKLQLGSTKHWNVYAHSFLYFGINLARERGGARIIHHADAVARRIDEGHESKTGSYYNPCLPGGFSANFTSKIHFSDGIESWKSHSVVGKDAAPYTVVFYGGESSGDFEKCHDVTVEILRLESNAWCNFSHGGDCSFAGIYQPPVPAQSPHFGEFFGLANYHTFWSFADLPLKSTVGEVKAKAQEICSMSYSALKEYNHKRLAKRGKKKIKPDDDDDLETYCFLATYSYSMLSKGYGFSDSANITVASIINGQKVGWALGSALYEIVSMSALKMKARVNAR